MFSEHRLAPIESETRGGSYDEVHILGKEVPPGGMGYDIRIDIRIVRKNVLTV